MVSTSVRYHHNVYVLEITIVAGAATTIIHITPTEFNDLKDQVDNAMRKVEH